MQNPIRILHISDTHWASDPIRPDIDPKSRFDQLCDWIASLNQPIDAIIHSGDWVHRAQFSEDSGDSTRAAWNRLSQLGIPILTAVGNHDNRLALLECLQSSLPAHWNLDPVASQEPRLAYSISFTDQGRPDESIMVLDARDSQEIDPRGRLCMDQLTAVEKLLSNPHSNWTIFLHYPPIQLDCDWIDRTMLIENGKQLHQILTRNSSRIRGVFFGHIHRPICCHKDSILYASAGSSTMHFPNMPTDSQAIMQSDPIAFANYISISEGSTLVKTQWTMIKPCLP